MIFIFLIHLQFTLTNNALFHFFPSIFRAVLYPVLISLIKQESGDCAACVSWPECSLFTCVWCPLFQSSLLRALLGELPPSQGKVSVQGRIAYVSQQPWVFPGTVRSNILFGKKYEKQRYEEVIKACALEEVSNDFWVVPEFQIMRNWFKLEVRFVESSFFVCLFFCLFFLKVWNIIQCCLIFMVVSWVRMQAYMLLFNPEVIRTLTECCSLGGWLFHFVKCHSLLTYSFTIMKISKTREHSVTNPHVPIPSFSQVQLVASLAESLLLLHVSPIRHPRLFWSRS